MIERVFHVGLSVFDLDAMLAFYRDVIGLTVDRVVPHPRGGTIAFMRGSAAEVLEMIRYDDPAPIDPARRERRQTGIHHFGLQVADARAVHERLVAAGVELDGDLRENATGDLVIHFWDPEGNRLHVTQPRGAK